MGERTILVCDVCGRPAAETATIRVGRRNLVKDLCSAHVAELVAGARRPRPGRRKATVVPAETPAKATAGRRGRRPKAAQGSA